MIIQLPDGERRELNNLLSIEEKCVVVENILNEFEDYIIKSWESQNTIYFLNGLSNYLVWHKDEDKKYKHEKNILSKRKTILLEDSAGFICADEISIYPPGIPLLLPGERLDTQMVDFLIEAVCMGITVHGLGGYRQSEITVISEEI